MLEKYIKEELIFLNLEANSREELFDKVADVYLEKDWVKSGFLDYLNEREDEFPTGLALEGYNVAIPHGNPEYIEQSFVSLVTLKEPIMMNKMEDADEAIPVDVFFFLGLTDGSEHLTTLQHVIKLIQDKEVIKKIKEAKQRADVCIALG